MDWDLSPDLPPEALEFVLVAVDAFLDLLKERGAGALVIGRDSRPTGALLLALAARLLRARGIEVRCADLAPVPQVMAACRLSEAGGFLYFTASHNPPGHNGLKLGLADGAVLEGTLARRLIETVKREYLEGRRAALLWSEIRTSPREPSGEKTGEFRERARRLYESFAFEALAGANAASLRNRLNDFFAPRAPAIVMDMNGSSRLLGPDLDLLRGIGLRVELLGGEPGIFEHAIVPEGASLEPCRRRMQELLDRGEPVLLGLVPDCDGDRGNLILPVGGKARPLAAQETFLLACLAEVSARREAGFAGLLAVAANDATSLRADRLLAPFAARVFRAETGEGSVLAKARELREQGWLVPLSGEGSNGGNILHPSSVRDPLMTLLSLLRWLAAGTAARFLAQRGRCPSREHELEEALALLPAGRTTDAFEPEALLPLPRIEHEVLKTRYERDLRAHFENERGFWLAAGIAALRFVNYEGPRAVPGPGNRTPPGRGGLGIELLDASENARGFLWMRGSGTEPVFRLMADWDGTDATYAALLKLHRELIERAARG